MRSISIHLFGIWLRRNNNDLGLDLRDFVEIQLHSDFPVMNPKHQKEIDSRYWFLQITLNKRTKKKKKNWNLFLTENVLALSERFDGGF